MGFFKLNANHKTIGTDWYSGSKMSIKQEISMNCISKPAEHISIVSK